MIYLRVERGIICIECLWQLASVPICKLHFIQVICSCNVNARQQPPCSAAFAACEIFPADNSLRFRLGKLRDRERFVKSWGHLAGRDTHTQMQSKTPRSAMGHQALSYRQTLDNMGIVKGHPILSCGHKVYLSLCTSWMPSKGSIFCGRG